MNGSGVLERVPEVIPDRISEEILEEFQRAMYEVDPSPSNVARALHALSQRARL